MSTGLFPTVEAQKRLARNGVIQVRSVDPMRAGLGQVQPGR